MGCCGSQPARAAAPAHLEQEIKDSQIASEKQATTTASSTNTNNSVAPKTTTATTAVTTIAASTTEAKESKTSEKTLEEATNWGDESHPMYLIFAISFGAKLPDGIDTDYLRVYTQKLNRFFFRLNAPTFFSMLDEVSDNPSETDTIKKVLMAQLGVDSVEDSEYLKEERSKNPDGYLISTAKSTIFRYLKPGMTDEEWLKCRVCLCSFQSLQGQQFRLMGNKKELYNEGVVTEIKDYAASHLKTVKELIDKEIGNEEIAKFSLVGEKIGEMDDLADHRQPMPDWFILEEKVDDREKAANFIIHLSQYLQMFGMGSVEQVERIVQARFLWFRFHANLLNDYFGVQFKELFGEKKFKHAPIKANARVFVKMSEDYENDPSKVLDWVRAIVVCDDVDDLIVQYNKLKNYCDESNKKEKGSKFKIVRIKNNFNDVFSTTWYSLCVNLLWESALETQSGKDTGVVLKHVCEIQFTLAKIYKHKSLMHRLYKIQRVEKLEHWMYVE